MLKRVRHGSCLTIPEETIVYRYHDDEEDIVSGLTRRVDYNLNSISAHQTASSTSSSRLQTITLAVSAPGADPPGFLHIIPLH